MSINADQLTVFDLVGRTIKIGGQEYLNKSNLELRGWTNSLIRKFLGHSDATTENPKYLYAAPQQLFLFDRGKRVEETQEFQAALDRTYKRRAAGKAAAETSRRRNIAKVDEIQFEVRWMDRAELNRRACDSYNERERHKRVRTHFEPATAESDPSFLERICVNYLRHHCTNYHNGLTTVRGRSGVQQAAHKMRGKVIAAIAEKSPFLREACLRQYPSLASLESKISGPIGEEV